MTDKFVQVLEAWNKYRQDEIDITKEYDALSLDDGKEAYVNIQLLSEEELIGLLGELEAYNRSLEEVYREQTEKLSANLWRLNIWETTTTRLEFDPFVYAIKLSQGFKTKLTLGLEEALKELLKVEPRQMGLFTGNEKTEAKLRVIEQFVKLHKMETSATGDKLVMELLYMIPRSMRQVYPKSCYAAAMKVLSSLYPEDAARLQGNMEELAKANIPENQNIEATTLSLPSFKQLACDKVALWKQLNITPTVAKVKMATGSKLSDEEIYALLHELNIVTEGAATIDPANKYRVDIAQRVYAEKVFATNPTTQTQSQAQTTTPVKDGVMAHREPTTGCLFNAVAIVCGFFAFYWFIMNKPTSALIAGGICVCMFLFKKKRKK